MELHQTCYCYWNLDVPDLSVVGPWLREHVAPRETCDGGRSVLLQLGTVFPTASFPRTVPAYLKETPYDDPAMIEAFARFWSALSEVIAANLPDATRVEDGRVIVDPPEVIVSIGNEVDLYLDAPMSVDGTPEQAWERYAAFYAKAADWVRGRDVDLDGDGLLEANPSNLSFPRSVTFSSTWMTCSPGWRVAHLGSPCSPARPPIASYLAMASSSDFWSFTRYVPFAGYDPEPEDVYATARAEVSEDLVGMGTVSVLGAWGGVTPVQRPLLIQEMGFPSSRAYPWDNELAEQQADYVAGAFDAWTEYNQHWTPLPEWWANVRLPPSEYWLESPLTEPRALAFNLDFAPPSPSCRTPRIFRPSRCPSCSRWRCHRSARRTPIGLEICFGFRYSVRRRREIQVQLVHAARFLDAQRPGSERLPVLGAGHWRGGAELLVGPVRGGRHAEAGGGAVPRALPGGQPAGAGPQPGVRAVLVRHAELLAAFGPLGARRARDGGAMRPRRRRACCASAEGVREPRAVAVRCARAPRGGVRRLDVGERRREGRGDGRRVHGSGEAAAAGPHSNPTSTSSQSGQLRM